MVLINFGKNEIQNFFLVVNDGLESPMLYTKFPGNWSAGSGKDFLRFLPYMGMAAILVM